MKKTTLNIAVLFLFTLSPIQGFAEDAYKGSWYALPGVSYVNTGSEIKADDGVAGALRGGKQLDENWDIQFGGSYAQADAQNGKYKQTLIGVDALYMLDRSNLSPFILAGVGIAQNDANGNLPTGGSKTSWMINVGAGVQYAFSDKIGLQADVRRVLSEVKGVESSVGNTYLNLALIINFDAPKKTVVAEKTIEAPLETAKPTAPPVVEIKEPVDPVELPKAPEQVVVEDHSVVAEACQPRFELVSVSAKALFGFDKYIITEKGRRILDSAADKLKANVDVDLVMVTGHADKIGTKQYNLKLSERRAIAVKTYLVSKGVGASRLTTAGRGESEPVVACNGLVGKKLIACLLPNRNVVFSAEKQHESACK